MLGIATTRLFRYVLSAAVWILTTDLFAAGSYDLLVIYVQGYMNSRSFTGTSFIMQSMSVARDSNVTKDDSALAAISGKLSV